MQDRMVLAFQQKSDFLYSNKLKKFTGGTDDRVSGDNEGANVGQDELGIET